MDHLQREALQDAPHTIARALSDLRALAQSVEGEVRLGAHDRLLYATDASLYQVEPLGVVIPASIDDAERAVRACADLGAPILPRGGGTSLAGQCVNRAVVIDFSARCRAVGEVDAQSRRVRVEPGVTLDELNTEIARRGHRLFFAPDVATSRHANIGGMIGNNSAGARSILYGRTAEHVLAVEALVVGEGGVERLRFERAPSDERVRAIARRVAEVVRRNAPHIRERFPGTLRRVNGYNLDMMLDQLDQLEHGGEDNLNLAGLLVGSEGTLGVTLAADLNLTALPLAAGLAVVGFPSLREAIEAVNPILTIGPSAVELLDDMVITLAQGNPLHRRYVDLLPKIDNRPPAAVLYVEVCAQHDEREIDQKLAALRALLPDAPISVHRQPAQIDAAWALRKAGEPLLHGVAGGRKPITFVEDTAVAPERLPDFVEDFQRIVTRHATRAAFFAHASVGCLHIRPLLDPHDAADRDRIVAIAQEVTDLVRTYEGALSGEHGDGRVRSPLLERFYGPELVRAFREIKHIFDPRNLLNPGNIVGEKEERAIITDLRITAGAKGEHAARNIQTHYDYADQGGFLEAVEMCNGAGVCRKKQGGTMCPSFMALLDERHATRGRANALRLAITGQLGQPGEPNWNDAETIKTLDLCLSCKACKAECPSNVDVARLKAEYTAQRNRRRRLPPLRALLVGNVRALQRAGAIAPRLMTALQNSPLTRMLANPLLGLAPERPLPAFGRPLARWAGKRGAPDNAAPRVALFQDCFTGYGESEIGRAAVELLEAFGYRVEIIDAGCCTRPMLSTGLLKSARTAGDRTLARLRSAIEDDTLAAILTLEPSCLSAFVDDWPLLRMSTDAALRARLAARSDLVEDFLDERWDEHPKRPAFHQPAGRVVLHAHCHQKALWGAQTSAALLERAFPGRVETLDSGCCGMAGYFGYEAGKYALSQAIGELALLPAARSLGPEDVLVAPGASCRHQVRDATGRTPPHPVQLLRDHLTTPQAQARSTP